MLALLFILTVLKVLGSSAEVERFTGFQVDRYFRTINEDAEFSEACRLSVAEYANISSNPMDFYVDSFAVGSSDSYGHVDHSRWIHSAVSCAKAAGGSFLVPPSNRFEYCYGETSEDEYVGVCLPESCFSDRDSALLKWYDTFKNQSLHSDVVLKNPGKCLASRWEKQWYQKPLPIFDTLLQVFINFVAISTTVYDLYLRKKNRKPTTTAQKTLVSFSLRTNFPKLYAIPPDPNATISCLYGMRFFSLVWTVLGHSYLVLLPFLDNLEALKRDLMGFFAQIITNFTLCVDTFFVLSGTLTAYSWFRRQKKVPVGQEPTWKSFGYWLKFYRHRLIRLWPAYVYVLFTVASRYAVAHYHPVWPTIDPSVQCQSYWWQNLLFLNTIFPNRCLPWLWYLGDDFIFYLISPIFLLLLRWRPIFATLIMATLGIISAVIRYLIVAAYNFPPTQFLWIQPEIFNPDFISHHIDLYIKPYARIGPYLVGIWLGFFLQEKSKKLQKRGINRWVKICCWLLSISGALWAVFGLYPALLGLDWPIYNTLFASVHRTVFALAVSWVILACHTGHAALINTMLSIKPWVFLGNLSYGCYLFHVIIIAGTYLFFSSFPMQWKGHGIHAIYFFVQLILSYLSGIIICLDVELPFLNLEKLFLQEKKQKNILGSLCLKVSGKREVSSESQFNSQSASDTALNDTIMGEA